MMKCETQGFSDYQENFSPFTPPPSCPVLLYPNPLPPIPDVQEKLQLCISEKTETVFQNFAFLNLLINSLSCRVKGAVVDKRVRT